MSRKLLRDDQWEKIYIGFGNVQALVWNHIIIGIILVIVGVWAGLASNVGTAKTMLIIHSS